MAITMPPGPSKTRLSRPGSSFLVPVIVALIIAALAYFGLYFYQNMLEKRGLEIDVLLEEQRTDQMEEIERVVTEKGEKINSFTGLLNAHKKNSEFFKFFQGVCHPKVFFSSISLNAEEGKVDLSGTTESFRTLGQQISILRKENIINNVHLSGLSLGKTGDIGFSLSFSVYPGIFK